MLTSLGRKPHDESLLGLLGACHQRIRSFARQALTTAQSSEASDAERIASCQSVARYFREALPLHVQDEHESIAPRIRTRSAEVRAAVDRMELEHHEHLPELSALLQALEDLARLPSREANRSELASCAARMIDAFEAHLVHEETVLFPAIALLDASVQDEIIRELRGRRQRFPAVE
ncbi:MAG: hemerythrin domain-containing protein [Deltaproteobacteria bacterium]|nr:hemerythrin domain-containing protein [Deltaproteobacteria bacterium]